VTNLEIFQIHHFYQSEFYHRNLLILYSTMYLWQMLVNQLVVVVMLVILPISK